MTALPYLDAEATSTALDWAAAIDAVAAAVAGLDQVVNPARSALPAGTGEMLLMPAATEHAAGVKVVSIVPGNPAAGLPRIQGVYILFDGATLTPLAVLDGAALTTLRTPAVSAFAVAALAPPTARSLLVFGAGPQAEAHVHAINAIRPLSAVTVVGRDPVRCTAVVGQLQRSGVPAQVGTADGVDEVDIVVCATTARSPLFDGERLAPNACVVAIGSHEPDARELDDAVLRRADRIVVEDIPTALREAGDVIAAVSSGVVTPERLTGLDQLSRLGPSTGISVFKSVGMAWQDLAVAVAVVAAHSRRS